MQSHEKAVNKRQCYKEGIAQVLPVGLFARVTCVAVKSTARVAHLSSQLLHAPQLKRGLRCNRRPTSALALPRQRLMRHKYTGVRY